MKICVSVLAVGLMCCAVSRAQAEGPAELSALDKSVLGQEREVKPTNSSAVWVRPKPPEDFNPFGGPPRSSLPEMQNMANMAGMSNAAMSGTMVCENGVCRLQGEQGAHGGSSSCEACNACGQCSSCGCGCEQSCGCEHSCGCQQSCGCEHSCGCQQSCGCHSGCDSCCDDCCCKESGWYAIGEATYLHRDNRTGNQALVIDGVTDATVLSTGDLEFDWEPGLRVIVGYCCCDTKGVEFTYFGLNEWDANAAVTGPGTLELPGGLGATINGFDVGTTNYASRIHDAELNYVESWDWVTWMGGFRFFHLDEQFQLNSFALPTDLSQYNISTRNNLYGGQLGVRFKGGGGRWGWDATGKAGLYANIADQGQSLTDLTGTVIRDASASGTDLAFVGDVGANLVYRITDCMSIRGGYNVLWVENVALAPSQIDFNAGPGTGTALNNGSGVFYHGANAGVIFHW